MEEKRKKLSTLLLCGVLVAILTACAENKGTVYEPSLFRENKVNENTEEAEDSNSNILIAYFTWAENTHVENPEAVDVDAIHPQASFRPAIRQNASV